SSSLHFLLPVSAHTHCPSFVPDQPVFREAPVLGYFLIGFPLAVGCIFCYLCIKNRPTSADDYEDAPLLAPSLQRKKKLAEKKSD
ncbi:hypothetical protein XENOCAPTIV_021628, partial [Xenoophorus captivus]